MINTETSDIQVGTEAPNVPDATEETDEPDRENKPESQSVTPEPEEQQTLTMIGRKVKMTKVKTMKLLLKKMSTLTEKTYSHDYSILLKMLTLIMTTGILVLDLIFGIKSFA